MQTSLEGSWHLRDVHLFQNLSEPDLARLGKIFRQAYYKINELLFLIDEPAERLFFLQSGIVKLCSITPEGDEKVIDIFQPGDVFGEMFLSETRRYVYQAEALEELSVATLTQKGFKALMQSFPELCLTLVRHMVEHHRHTMAMLETLMRTDASQRLLRVLLFLGDRQGHARHDHYQLHPSLTQEDLANMVGLNRTTVSLQINQWRRQGVLGGSGRSIIIYRAEVEAILGHDTSVKEG